MEDHAISIGNKTELFQPSIFLNKCLPGTVVVLTKELNNESIYLHSFAVEKHYLIDLSKHLINYPESDFVYCTNYTDIKEFEKDLGIIQIGIPKVLRRYNL